MATENEQAEELLRRGKYAEAVERFRNLLSIDPENAELRGRTGEAYRLSGNRERAFHHFHKAAAIYGRRNDLEAALRMLKAANAVSPNEPDVLFRMAECQKSLGLFGEMEPTLRQIVLVAVASGDRRRVWALEELALIYPDDLDVGIRRAQALGEAHRIDDAVTAWKRVSARLDHRAGDFVAMLQQAASLAPDRPDIGVDLAGILLANKRPRDALALLVPYYEKFPDQVEVLETLLRALEALKAHDKIVAARIELVKVRTKLGQRAQALSDLAALQKIAPEDPLALEVVAHSCATFGLVGEACRAWYSLAEIADAHRDAATRDRAILLLLKNNPNHIGGLQLGARVLREAGRPDEAASLERRLRELERGGDSLGELPGVDSAPGAPLRAPKTPAPNDPWKVGTGSMELDDDDVVAEASEEELHAPTTPEDLILPSDLADVSEPAVEAMPIHRNPWAEGLEIEVQRANAETQLRTRPNFQTPRPMVGGGFDLDDAEATAGNGLEASIEAPLEAEETTSRFDAMESSELRSLRSSVEVDAPEELTTLAPSGFVPVKSPGSQPLRPEEFVGTGKIARPQAGPKKGGA
ncbi:MAG: tetratricopeptide repeat protein [Deltaproteobacteria bacterium]|nr:tetratricopeptide repeat protein [Deltaproteobacteria bacterium]